MSNGELSFPGVRRPNGIADDFVHNYEITLEVPGRQHYTMLVKKWTFFVKFPTI